jgi:Uncharacterized membrane protein
MQGSKVVQQNKLSALKIAGAYIGTVVGAGFGSGQETLQFFAVYGDYGFIGLLIVTALFMLYGYIIMDMGYRLNSKSHLSIIKHSMGKYLTGIVDIIITFFLFGAVTSMIAGTGAMLRQQFGVPAVFGNILMAVITTITVLTGFNGIINSISFVVPFMIAAAVAVSIISLFFAAPGGGAANVRTSGSGLISNWLWAAILYTSYNIILSAAVLGPLGSQARNRKEIKNGAILGGLGLGFGAIAIYYAIITHMGSVAGLEIPMIYIAGRISPIMEGVYAAALIAEIYTTAVGSLYGFAARVVDMDSPKVRPVIIGTAAAAFVASQFGFSNIVKYLYPAVGYGGILLLVGLLYSRLKEAPKQG